MRINHVGCWRSKRLSLSLKYVKEHKKIEYLFVHDNMIKKKIKPTLLCNNPFVLLSLFLPLFLCLSLNICRFNSHSPSV